MLDVIYFSSVTNMTHRFVQKLDAPSQRLPVRRTDDPVFATNPFLLITPTYGNGTPRGAVPKQVIHFLNVPENRALLRAVIAGGNRNFGAGYGAAGPIIARKCDVPYLGAFELMGMPDDVQWVQDYLDRTAEVSLAR